MAELHGKRIVIAKPGVDGHDVGAKIIALTLRDAGRMSSIRACANRRNILPESPSTRTPMPWG